MKKNQMKKFNPLFDSVGRDGENKEEIEREDLEVLFKVTFVCMGIYPSFHIYRFRIRKTLSFM